MFRRRRRRSTSRPPRRQLAARRLAGDVERSADTKPAEPWFLTLNAKIDAEPAVVLEDLGKAGPGVQQAGEKYG